MINKLFSKLKPGILAVIFLFQGISLSAMNFDSDEFQKVILLFTNDMHGGIARVEARFMNPEFPPLIGNGPAVAGYLKEVRKDAKENGWGILMTDAGDFYSGTPVGTMTKGKAVVEFMNAVGYDAMAVGNHDFDKGWEALKERSTEANYPFLAANIINTNTGTYPDYIKPYIIKDIMGIKFGIIGIATATTPSMSFPDHVKDLDFLAEIPTLQKIVPEVKAAGADIIVVLSHMWQDYDRDIAAQELFEKGYENIDPNKIGADGMEAAAAVPGIDIMFTGHVHKGFPKPYEDPINHTLIFQNYANGSNIGHANIYIHKATKTLAGFDFAIDNNDLITLMEDEFWIDPEVDAMISAHVTEAEKGFDEVLTVLKTPLRRGGSGESVLGNMIVDAMIYATDADIAFSNFGGIRADLEAGPLTPRDLFAVLPFGNKITIFQVSGQFILDLVESRVKGNSRGMVLSGAIIKVDKRKADGSRVSIVSIGGKALEKEKIYRLAVSDYLAEGNSGYMNLTEVDASSVNYTGIVIRQALIDYLQTEKGQQTKVDGRWTVITE